MAPICSYGKVGETSRFALVPLYVCAFFCKYIGHKTVACFSQQPVVRERLANSLF